MNGVEPIDKVPDKKIFFVIGVFFGILVLLSITFFVLSNIGRTNNPSGGGLFTNRDNGDKETTKDPATKVTPTIAYPPPPTLQTDKWTFALRTKPNNVVAAQTYAFKQNYTSQEIRSFAEKLFRPASIKTTKNQVLAYTLDNSTKDTEALRFNPQSGAFSFVTTKGIPLASGSGQLISNEMVYDFLRNIDIYDPSIVVTAQYKKNTQPNLTYIELHRDWRKAGLPILNFIGLLNLPESQNLANLTLNSNVSAIADGSVVSSTDGKAGYQRMDDFNTITIIVRTGDRKIIGMESNLRKIDTDKSKTTNLITYAQAEEKLIANGYDLIFNSPSGNGTVTWEKIYPNNKAVATETIVTDAIYTYLEQPPLLAQSEMKPYILFKGYSTLKNGYRSDFVATVPADSSVLGISTLAQSSPELPEEDSAASQRDVETGPGGSLVDPNVPAPTIPAECADPHNRIAPFDKVITFMGLTLAHSPSFSYDKWVNDAWTGPFEENNGGHGDWYYIPARNLTADELQSVLTADLRMINNNLLAFMDAIGYTGGEGFRGDNHAGDWTAVWNDVNHTWGDDRVNYVHSARCPIRLTGHSPTLFVYGKAGQTVQIYPSETIYVDPSLNYNRWVVTIKDNFDLIVNGSSRPYLYYEYSSVTFNKPRLGWNVDKNQLANFSSKLAAQLGLNSTERDRLEVELNHSANMVADDKLFIGIIDSQELNKKLPLKISPQPEKVYRYHFYISSANGKISTPKLSPLQRSEFMIVELGSYAAQ